MSDSATPKIIIKHRYTDAVLHEYQPTEEQRARGLAMRAALETARLSGAYLSGANLSGAYLSDANLSDANLSDANMYGANLSGANLSDANLSDASLRGAYLSGADLRGANVDGADLRGAYLRGTKLHGAYLDGAKNLIGDRPVFTLGPIGSRCEYFTAYLTDKGVYLRAGCFFGVVAEFVAKLERVHGTNKHWQEYSAALALIECHARLWTPDASQAEATAEEA